MTLATSCIFWLVLDVLHWSHSAPSQAIMSLVSTSTLTQISLKHKLVAMHALELEMQSRTAARLIDMPQVLGLTGMPEAAQMP